MTTPEERREMYLDAQEQTEEWNRAMRDEERDAAITWDPRDDPNHPDRADLAQMAAWDRETERRERETGR